MALLLWSCNQTNNYGGAETTSSRVATEAEAENTAEAIPAAEPEATRSAPQFTEESLPRESAPAETPTPQSESTPEAAELPASPPSVAESAPTTSAPAVPQAASPTETPPVGMPTSVEAQGTAAQPSPTPQPYELGSIAPQISVSGQPLDPYIKQARDSGQSARAASIRVAEEARQDLAANNPDGALQKLSPALSIDPSSPYCYFFLGRAYLMKKNYEQAIVFLKRAEIYFGDNPAWLGETLSFEGAAYEESGQKALAQTAYQQAIDKSPGNLMARVGLTRVSAAAQPDNAAAQAAPAVGPEEAPPWPPPGPAPAESPPPSAPIEPTPGPP